MISKEPDSKLLNCNDLAYFHSFAVEVNGE